MRGIASIASAVAPESASARVDAGLVSGAKNPTRIDEPPSAEIWSGSGGVIVTTTSLAHTSPASSVSCAPARSNASPGSSAASPAPRCTSTSTPFAFSLPTTSGTSATRCSPAALSFGTPIRIGPATYPIRPPRVCETRTERDRQPHPHLHQARRRRRDAPRRHEPGLEAAPARGGIRSRMPPRAGAASRPGPCSSRCTPCRRSARSRGAAASTCWKPTGSAPRRSCCPPTTS